MSSPPPVLEPQIERELEAQIEPWLSHMRWRADFAEWRMKRLWQENYQSAAMRQVRAARNGARPGPVLDIGSGMGGFAVAMRRSGEELYALDYNPAYCEIARTRARRYGLDLPALVGAGEALPFATASFEEVTCWDVLEHVVSPEQLLGEIARVLAPGGRLFMTVINRFALVDPHYHLRFVNYLPRPLGEKYIGWRQRRKQSALRDRQGLSEMHYFTYTAFEQFAARRGFRLEDLNRAGSRLRAYPQPLGNALYGAWRMFGMGTFSLLLRKTDAPA